MDAEIRPGARLDGTTIGRIRAAHPEVRILPVTQCGAGYVAVPAHQMTLGPGDLVLLLGPGRRGPGWRRLTSPRPGPGGNGASVGGQVTGGTQFLPDQFLGAHGRRATGRRDMHVWLGERRVHAGISPADLRRKATPSPRRSCSSIPSAGARPPLVAGRYGDLPAGRTGGLSTGGLLEAPRTTTAPAVLVATETGILHQLRRANPAVRREPVNPDAVCRYMKMTTPAALLRCLRDGVTEVTVAPDVAGRARRAVQAMIAAGSAPVPAGVSAGGSA